MEESRPLLQQIPNELAAQVGEVLVNESNLQLGQTIGQGKIGDQITTHCPTLKLDVM